MPWHQSVLGQLLARTESLAPVLLLVGPAGIGKRRLAEALGAALLCESPGLQRMACGHCSACRWVAAESHPDFRRLTLEQDADGKWARDLKIAQVRALGEFLTVGGHRGGRRVVLIDPADALTTESANALLKTLEEPGPGLTFLLVTARPSALPLTLRSRSQVLSLRPPALPDALAWLSGQGTLGDSEARAALALAGGAPLLALADSEPGRAAIHRQALEAIAELPDTSVMSVTDVLAALEPRLWLGWLQRWLLDLARCRAGAAPLAFQGQARRLQALAQRTRPPGLAEASLGLVALSRLADHPLNPRLFCEDALTEYLKAFRA